MNETIKKAAAKINDPSLPRRIQLRKQINNAEAELQYKQITITAWKRELAQLEELWANQSQHQIEFPDEPSRTR